MTTRAHVIGWGKAVPDLILTNEDMAKIVDTSDEWIQTRTGIRERRKVVDGETTFTLSLEAAQRALAVAKFRSTELDLIIVATVTPDHAFPATACMLQDTLGASHAAAFDLSAGCTGFVYALSIASDLIAAGVYRSALVIGAETLTRITNYEDRGTCVLFGDGAGAVVLQADGADGGVLSSVLGSDGSGGDLLKMPAGGSRFPASRETVENKLHSITMKGREVFRFAVGVMPSATRQVLELAGLELSDLSLIVPHQANQRIIDASLRSLGLPAERAFTNLASYGNTSSASIPMALCEAAEQGCIKRDDVVVCVGFGAGLTWGATAIRWSVPLPVVKSTPWQQVVRQVRYRYARWRSRIRQIIRWLMALLVKE